MSSVNEKDSVKEDPQEHNRQQEQQNEQKNEQKNEQNEQNEQKNETQTSKRMKVEEDSDNVGTSRDQPPQSLGSALAVTARPLDGSEVLLRNGSDNADIEHHISRSLFHNLRVFVALYHLWTQNQATANCISHYDTPAGMVTQPFAYGVKMLSKYEVIDNMIIIPHAMAILRRLCNVQGLAITARNADILLFTAICLAGKVLSDEKQYGTRTYEKLTGLQSGAMRLAEARMLVDLDWNVTFTLAELEVEQRLLQRYSESQ